MAAERFMFTKARLRGLRFEGQRQQIVAYDEGCRGLAVGVGSTGVHFLIYRRVKGRPVKVALGKFDPNASETKELPPGIDPLSLLGNRPMLNVRIARLLATAVNAQLDAGNNPAQARRKARGEMTLGELFGHYIRHLEAEGKRSVPLWKFYWERYLGDLPNEPKKKHGQKRTKPEGTVNWERRPLSSVTFEDVQRLRLALAERRTKTTANHIIGMIGTLYRFAIKRRLYRGENPAFGVDKFKVQARDRFLQPDEVGRFFQALEGEPDETMRDFFRLGLLTGARRGNLMAARWDELNFEAKTWRIGMTKNGEPHCVPLVDEALEILRRRASNAKSVYWVFPAKSVEGHIGKGAVRTAWARITKRAELTDLNLHDLRRSLGSWMASSGATPQMTMKALGHKTIAASLIYQRMNHDPARAAMQKAVTELMKAAAKKPEVVQLPSMAARGGR
jgi:integrase